MSDEFQSEGPPGITKDDIEYEKSNPNLAHAVPRGEGRTLAEKMDAIQEGTGTYPDIVEGSDSERTGTSWGIEGVEGSPDVETPSGEQSEGTSKGDAQPNRNTDEVTERDALKDTGSWSTISTDDSAGSPTGGS